MKKIKKIVGCALSVVFAAQMCGCSIKTGTNTDPKDSYVVVKATEGKNVGDLSITYGDFSKEYRYYLNAQKIEDDTAEDVAEQCKEQRKSIIDNLIVERIILHKAEEYEVNSLTDEEEEQVEQEFQSQIQSQIDYFSENADYSDTQSDAESGSSAESTADTIDTSDSDSTESSGETSGNESSAYEPTEEEKQQRGSEELDKFLASCDMTRDDLRGWIRNAAISKKLMDKMSEDVERSDAESVTSDYIEQFEAMYEQDPASYEQGNYNILWIPEGSRRIKHILLGFDENVQTQIQTLRSDGKDDEADTLRGKEAEKLQEKVDEVQKKLDEGGEIDELINEYSSDTAGSTAYPDGYLVIPNGQSYMKEFQEAAFVPEKIGERAVCTTDYGVHIMIYADDAKVSQSNIESFTDYVYSQQQQEHYYDMIYEWQDGYKFDIDYEALRIDDPNAPVESSSELSDDGSSAASDVSNSSDETVSSD